MLVESMKDQKVSLTEKAENKHLLFYSRAEANDRVHLIAEQLVGIARLQAVLLGGLSVHLIDSMDTDIRVSNLALVEVLVSGQQ